MWHRCVDEVLLLQGPTARAITSTEVSNAEMLSTDTNVWKCLGRC